MSCKLQCGWPVKSCPLPDKESGLLYTGYYVNCGFNIKIIK